MADDGRGGAPSPVTVRPVRPADHAAIDVLLRRAFGGADEAGLVAAMRADPGLLAEDVAASGRRLVGQVLWCRCTVAAGGENHPVAALGAMAVAPGSQRLGIGTALVRHGLDRLRRQGEPVVLVVGHPDYYPRFGFSAALAERWTCRWSGPAFMAARLGRAALPPAGEVAYPAPYYRFD